MIHFAPNSEKNIKRDLFGPFGLGAWALYDQSGIKWYSMRFNCREDNRTLGQICIKFPADTPPHRKQSFRDILVRGILAGMFKTEDDLNQGINDLLEATERKNKEDGLLP